MICQRSLFTILPKYRHIIIRFLFCDHSKALSFHVQLQELSLPKSWQMKRSKTRSRRMRRTRTQRTRRRRTRTQRTRTRRMRTRRMRTRRMRWKPARLGTDLKEAEIISIRFKLATCSHCAGWITCRGAVLYPGKSCDIAWYIMHEICANNTL